MKGARLATRPAKSAAPAQLKGKVTRVVTLDGNIERARQQWEKLCDSDKENALRGLFLGGLFDQIKAAAGHGNFLRLANERMPEIPQPRRNELMRLWHAFLGSTKRALPAGQEVPDAQLALQPNTPRNNVVRAAIKFVGTASLYDLMVEWEVRDKKPLGGARTARATALATALDAEQLSLFAMEEIGGGLETLKRMLITENLLQHIVVSQDHRPAALAVLEELRSLTQQVEAALKPFAKTATA